MNVRSLSYGASRSRNKGAASSGMTWLIAIPLPNSNPAAVVTREFRVVIEIVAEWRRMVAHDGHIE